MLLGMLLAACAPAEIPDAALQPYLTNTPNAASTPNVLVIAETPAPTNTLQIYIIEAGDTISEIAEKFRISQSALIAANPDANPNALVIGQTLFIPDPAAPPVAASTLTPMPVPVTQAACHPTADSGSWCFALVQNNTAGTLENVSAQITLFDNSNHIVASQSAFLPLDVLPANMSMPVYVFFPNTPTEVTPQVRLLSAMPGGSAYLPASLVNTSVQIDWDGRSAKLNGQVFLAADSKPANRVWVAAVAFDKYGRVIGVRRWEGGGIQPGASLNFEFNVAGVGGEIEAVEFFIQAQ